MEMDHSKHKEEEREECRFEWLEQRQEKVLVAAWIFKTNIDGVRCLEKADWDIGNWKQDILDVCKNWLYEPQTFYKLFSEILIINSIGYDSMIKFRKMRVKSRWEYSYLLKCRIEKNRRGYFESDYIELQAIRMEYIYNKLQKS